jgi:surface antigen
VFTASATPAKAWNCVQFVHQTSAVKLSGDAWRWWTAALGKYERGKEPEKKAVLVFDRTSRMVHGHVAIVANLVNDRLIQIDHANWSIGHYGRGKITRNVKVMDVSEKNDWTSVEVWNELDNCWGHPYRALGFVYSR